MNYYIKKPKPIKNIDLALSIALCVMIGAYISYFIDIFFSNPMTW